MDVLTAFLPSVARCCLSPKWTPKCTCQILMRTYNVLLNLDALDRLANQRINSHSANIRLRKCRCIISVVSI